MQVIDEPLEGLKLIKFDIYKDGRGFFAERYSHNEFARLGINNNFVQDNFSHSTAGVIRGLHYQTEPAQSKLVTVTRGKILDIAVDIRKNSQTFGQHFAVELSGDNGLMLFIPAGFAHGFCAVTEADVWYKVDGHYNPKTEAGLTYDDSELDIKWPVAEPVVSAKDASLPSFAQYKQRPVF